MENIFNEIKELRNIQINKLHYDYTHDDSLTEEEWIGLIEEYLSEQSTPYIRTRMLRVASLAIACIESIDRKEKK